MRISLSSPVRKAAFLGGGVTLLLLFWALACQTFAAYWIARQPTIQSYEKASRIQPLNARYSRVLGEYYLDRDHAKAVQYFERALRLNPQAATMWLELASAYDLVGQHTKQHEAVVRALADAPKDVTVQWEAANLYLAEGDIDTGLRLLREVAANDPSRTPMAMQIAYHATDGNIARTLDALPTTSSVRLQFLHWLVDRDHLPEADQVWPALMNATGKTHPADTFFYLDTLIARHNVAAAKAAWETLISRDSSLRNRMEIGNLVTNGDFEDNLLNGGFDWRYQAISGVTTTVDTTTFHGGTRSLELQFDAGDMSDAGVLEVIPVEPGARYILRAFLHGEELESANGVRISVSDFYSHDVLLLTDVSLGSFPWRETTGEFITGPDTQLLKLSFAQSPAIGRIRGRLWIDDLHIEKR